MEWTFVHEIHKLDFMDNILQLAYLLEYYCYFKNDYANKFWTKAVVSININFGFFYRYESNENMTIQVSTKVCSFGKQVVEKLETEFAKPDPSGRFIYKIQRSPMCEYMINFIHKLKHLPEKYMMNSVLENFTILQVSSILRIIDT